MLTCNFSIHQHKMVRPANEEASMSSLAALLFATRHSVVIFQSADGQRSLMQTIIFGAQICLNSFILWRFVISVSPIRP